MAIVREPEGVDFVVSSGRWSPEVAAEVAEFLRQIRQQPQSSPAPVARVKTDFDHSNAPPSKPGSISAST